ncbi:MAG: ABC transporter permease subunit [Clostridiales bacterium]|jgi:D-methionine transport system permease protein|nr:ABC transporter permease subunit [Clostridiales bacterium]MDY4654795.1 ABC transporter permease subunit [Eubacteriales bacterium]
MTFADILLLSGETLLMTVLSTALAYLFGLPCGILLNVTSKNGLKPCKWLNAIVGLIVNILRSVPCLIIIVLCIPWSRAWFGTGTGEWYTILIPLTVCAFGFVSRMVEQSLAEVPAGEIEAVRSLGATDFQLITKVLLPESKASLVTGAAVVAVSIIGYTSFAYNIGAGGLISGIYTYYTRHTGDYLKQSVFWILIAVVVVIVQLIQELGLKLAKKIDKRRILK